MNHRARVESCCALSLLLLLSGCGAGVWFQDVVMTSSVKNARPVTAVAAHPIATGHFLEFLAMGDPGTGRGGQQTVAQSMGNIAAAESVKFVVILGDNFYPSGVSSIDDEQWKEKFEEMYSAKSLQVPFYAVLGNHDYYTNPGAQVEYTKKGGRWTMPSRYYSFFSSVDETTQVQFFCLDTTPLDEEKTEEIDEGMELDSTDYRAQLQWLEGQLRASSARWKVVVGHHALYSGGVHGDNKGMIERLEPIFLKYRIDLYLAGHDHDLEMKKPIKGIHYVVSGGGGTHRSVTWMDNTLYAATNMGFNRFQISPTQMQIEFYDANGVVRYAYTIEKQK